jgi:diacylglycerol kinase (ATP)
VKAWAVLNPRAGLGARRARQALQGTHPVWGAIEVRETSHPGHARSLAREAVEAGADVVLAVGGDGTANETAEALLGTRAALGLVPMGSGNGLARTLRIPLTPRRALRALSGAVVRTMDVGVVNGRPFLNVSGAGLDAEVGAEFHAHGRSGGRRGLFTYVRLTLRMARTYEAREFRVEGGDETVLGPALIVAIVNGRQYGGGAVLAPRARLDDGRLDVVVFEKASFPEILMQVPRLFLGRIERFRRYRHVQASRVVVTSARPFRHHRDGEPEPESSRLEVTVEPRALRILVPRATADDPGGPFGPEAG